ncbi:unnamed protein product [Musa hybrid cultivar]
MTTMAAATHATTREMKRAEWIKVWASDGNGILLPILVMNERRGRSFFSIPSTQMVTGCQIIECWIELTTIITRAKKREKTNIFVLLSNETGRIWWMIEEKEDGILVLVTPCGRRRIGWFIKLKYTILRSS